MFLLSRIRSDVTITREHFDAGLRARADELVARLLEQAERNLAIVEVAAGSVAEARLAPRAVATPPSATQAVQPLTVPTLTVPTLDLHAFADELAGYGGEAVAIEPTALREYVIARLQRVHDAHRGESVELPGLVSTAAPTASTDGAKSTMVRAAKRPALHAAEAVTLMLSIVPYLIDHGPTAISELAEVFDVDARRLEHDIIPFIGMSGVPGETLTYQHEDLFDIDWNALEQHGVASLVQTVAVDDAPRFAPAETAALIAGLQALTPVLPESDAALARSTAQKLGAALGTEARAQQLISARGEGDTRPRIEQSAPELSVTTEAADPSLPVIVTAIDEGRTLRFDYRDAAGSSSARVVDPLVLMQEGGAWYLRGFCHDREAERTFRVDRMRGLATVADKRAASAVRTGETGRSGERAGERSDALSGRRSNPSETPVDPSSTFDLIAWIPERLLTRFQGFAPEILGTDGAARARVRIAAWNAGSAVRLVQEAPGEVIIESPAHARTAVGNWAERALSAYDI